MCAGVGVGSDAESMTRFALTAPCSKIACCGAACIIIADDGDDGKSADDDGGDDDDDDDNAAALVVGGAVVGACCCETVDQPVDGVAQMAAALGDGAAPSLSSPPSSQ